MSDADHIRINVDKISNPMKMAATKAFTDLGYSVRQIAKIMSIDPKTVLSYQKKEMDEEFQQFSNTVKKIYLEQDFELTQLAVKHLKDKIGDAKFYDLVGLLKMVRELQLPKGPSVAQQFNVGGGLSVKVVDDNGSNISTP